MRASATVARRVTALVTIIISAFWLNPPNCQGYFASPCNRIPLLVIRTSVFVSKIECRRKRALSVEAGGGGFWMVCVVDVEKFFVCGRQLICVCEGCVESFGYVDIHGVHCSEWHSVS